MAVRSGEDLFQHLPPPWQQCFILPRCDIARAIPAPPGRQSVGKGSLVVNGAGGDGGARAVPVLTAKAAPPGALGVRVAEQVPICKGGDVVSTEHGSEKVSGAAELPGGTLAPRAGHWNPRSRGWVPDSFTSLAGKQRIPGERAAGVPRVTRLALGTCDRG